MIAQQLLLGSPHLLVAMGLSQEVAVQGQVACGRATRELLPNQECASMLQVCVRASAGQGLVPEPSESGHSCKRR